MVAVQSLVQGHLQERVHDLPRCQVTLLMWRALYGKGLQGEKRRYRYGEYLQRCRPC